MAPGAFSADVETVSAQDEAFWRQRLAGRNTAYFVAEIGNALIGVAGVYVEEGMKVRHNATIVSVFVKESSRGRGVARELVEAAVGWASARPEVTIAKLGVSAVNAPAITTYLRCGFSVYGVDPRALFVDGEYIDELLMARRLR